MFFFSKLCIKPPMLVWNQIEKNHKWDRTNSRALFDFPVPLYVIEIGKHLSLHRKNYRHSHMNTCTGTMGLTKNSIS